MKMTIFSFLLSLAVPAVAMAGESPISVACVGDSITFGHGSTGGRTYPAQLQKILGDGWSVHNFGHNSRTARDDGKEWNNKTGLGYRDSPQFTKAKDSAPDIVVFMLGTNDTKPINWEEDGEAFRKGFTGLVEDFLALKPQPIVVIATSAFVKKQNWGINEETVGGQVVPWQIEFANQRKLPVVDVHSATKEHASEPGIFTNDGVHPADKGYELIAGLIAGKLQELAPEVKKRRASQPRKEPALSFGKDGAFSILHITDVQDRAKLSEIPEKILRDSIAAVKPGLIVMTGDNVESGGNGKEDLAKAMGPLVQIFKETKTPFCVTFGNHDSERKGEEFLTRQEQYDWFKEAGGEFFVDHDQPFLSGVGSGAIVLHAEGDKTATPLFRIYVMDSGDYAAGGYDGCRADQIAWYLQTAGAIPHIWFQHIIVPDVRDNGLFEASPDGKGRVSFKIRGKKEVVALASGAIGQIKEAPCPPSVQTYRDPRHTVDGKTLYEAWLENGHLVGAYFGHDHVNSFDGIDWNGIRLGATKGLTVSSYNDGDPGLRLIVLHEDGTFETELFTRQNPMPQPENDAPYRPSHPQVSPVVNRPAQEIFPPLKSFAVASEDAAGLFRPGLLCDISGCGFVPGPVQALASKNGIVSDPALALPAGFAEKWQSGEMFRYHGQFYSSGEALRFAERMYDFVLVKIDGETVMDAQVWQKAESSQKIQLKRGWHEIEIILSNASGRAGAAWPDYNDNGAPTFPGFGATSGDGDDTLDPTAYQFPFDPGDASIFRVPVDGFFTRLALIRPDKSGPEVELAIAELPIDMKFDAFWGDTDGGTTPGAWQHSATLGTLQAGTHGAATLHLPVGTGIPKAIRIRATNAETPENWGERLIEWTDLLRP